jgi:hypothetical protein
VIRGAGPMLGIKMMGLGFDGPASGERVQIRGAAGMLGIRMGVGAEGTAATRVSIWWMFRSSEIVVEDVAAAGIVVIVREGSEGRGDACKEVVWARVEGAIKRDREESKERDEENWARKTEGRTAREIVA